MEEPLLSSVGSVMPDVTSCKRRLLIEVFLAIPCAPVLVWYSKSFTVGKSHILDVAVVIVLKSSSYSPYFVI